MYLSAQCVLYCQPFSWFFLKVSRLKYWSEVWVLASHARIFSAICQLRCNEIPRTNCSFFPSQQIARHTEWFCRFVAYLRTWRLISTFSGHEKECHFVKRIKTMGEIKQVTESGGIEDSFYVERKFDCFSPTASVWSFVPLRSLASTSLMCIILFTQGSSNRSWNTSAHSSLSCPFDSVQAESTCLDTEEYLRLWILRIMARINSCVCDFVLPTQ